MAEVVTRSKTVAFEEVEARDDSDAERGSAEVKNVSADDPICATTEAAAERNQPRNERKVKTDISRSSGFSLDTPVSPSQRQRRFRRLSTCSMKQVRECLQDSLEQDVDEHGSVKSVKLAAKAKTTVRERLNFARMAIHFCKAKIHVENNSNVLNRSLSSLNRKQCGRNEDDESSSSEDDDKKFYCGYLLDVVKRKGYKNGRHLDKGGSRRRLLKALKEHNEGLYEYCLDSIKRDEFQSNIIEDITEYYKNADAVKFTNASASASAWKSTDSKAIKEQVARIVEHKRQVKCFSAELRQWLLLWSAHNAYVPDNEDCGLQKKNRIEEFFRQYRDHSNSFDFPLQHAKKTTTGSQNQSRAICFDADNQWEVINLLDARMSSSSFRTSSRPGTGLNTSMGSSSGFNASMCSSSGFNTHMRSSNRGGSVKYGLRWNMEAQTMKWEAVEPCEGSRAFNMLKQQNAMNIDLNTSPSGLKASFFLAVGPEAQNLGGLQASASAPALSKPTTPLNEKCKLSKQGLGKALSPAKKNVKLPPVSKGERRMSVSLKRDLPMDDLPTDKYIETCKRCMIFPTPLRFVTGHSFKMNVGGQNLLDGDLRALTAILKDVVAIDEIDLSDNTRLTEKVLLPLFERLFGEPATSTLMKLSLKNLPKMSTRSYDAINRLLSENEGVRELRHLNLAGASIPPKSHLSLARAVRDHPSMEELKLENTQMGVNSWVAQQCVEDLTASVTLKKLDIGWNCFDVDVFCHLGRCLVKNPHVSSLSLANCSSAAIDVQGRPPPITFFLESLAYDVSLTYLDLSLNRMDVKAALVMEDSLDKHPRLSWLEVSNNPMGTVGIRCLLRLLADRTSPVKFVDCKGCYDGGTVSPEESFNGVNPGGNYALDLSRPYHRSILRMLYKTCEKFNLPPDQAFYKVKFTRGLWTHCQVNGAGTYDLPQEGKLTFLFNVKNIFEQSLTSTDEENYGQFIDDHMTRVKTVPAFHKLTPIFATWKLLDGHQKDQMVFLNAIAKDFMLSAACVEILCTHCSILRGETIFRLFPSVIGGEFAEALCMLMFKSISEFLTYHKSLRVFIDFNVENPTGHYKLSLENPTHYAIAEKLLLLDHWETVLDKRNNRVDISNWNNGSHFRNETYKGVPFRIVDWMLPDCEVVEFDYVSRKRMSKDAAVMSDMAFNNVLISLYDAECSSESKLEVLQMTSHLLTITSMHMRKMLGTFKDPDHRAKTLMKFFLRVSDMWNSKIFRVRFDDPKIIQQLRSCLGDVLFFPFIQPENARFELDFTQYDQRLCATFLLTLGGKEGMGNLRDYHYIDANGVEVNLGTGVPKSWEKLKEVPTGGTFRCTYMCAPEHRKFKERLKMADRYAVFHMEVEEEHVQWATGLTEVDDDVLILLEHLVAYEVEPGKKFSNVYEAFTLIDGPGGNGVITILEFRDGLKELKFERFKTPRKDGIVADEHKRINDVFRYLDPGGEGSVSKAEWGVLDQLWYEYQLCIHEFVHFLQRTFGDDLMIAWGFLEACAKEGRSKDNSEDSRLHGSKDRLEKHHSMVSGLHHSRPASPMAPGPAKSWPLSSMAPDSDKSGQGPLLFKRESMAAKPELGKSGDEDLVELTCAEWVQACEDIGYFGPARCVFGLLDHSGDGNISKEEFDILEKYKADVH